MISGSPVILHQGVADGEIPRQVVRMEHHFPSSLPRGSQSGGPCRLAATIAAVSAAATRRQPRPPVAWKLPLQASEDAEPGTTAVYASSSQSVLDRLWESQRQNMQVLAVGILGAMLFGTFVTLTQGVVAGAEWFACYVIEYSLSVDNLFVFIVIFDYFKVTGDRQSQVLNYGIAGAVVLRFLFVYLGAQLLQRFDFLILFFAAILVYASYQGLASRDDDDDDDNSDSIEEYGVYKALKNLFEISPRLDGDKFFTELDGRTVATPLLLCLLVVEFSDIVFATDSVPAVLGTTKDPFIAYSSNIFAVFGLRSLFFILREAMTRFTYLEPAVSFVLGFIGLKIVVDYFEIIEAQRSGNGAIGDVVVSGGKRTCIACAWALSWAARGAPIFVHPEDRNPVLMWDGKPESFAHFVTEIKWTLCATKKDERPLLAARIIKKALQQGQSTLVQLMYKLDPDDFRTEGSVNRIVKYLEESPLNRQPLPDAGNKIGAYYRRLLRKGQEPLPAFLIREDKVHDDMLRALQRLLRVRELAFDDYDATLEEPKTFCGMSMDESLYYGPSEGEPPEDEDGEPGEAAEEDGEGESTRRPRSRSGSRTSRSRGRSAGSSTSTKGKGKGKDVDFQPKGKDLLQRLMGKGLMPLSALDIIRGWMVLEMSTATEEERRIIKAATRNRLGYAEVRQALLAMYEDRGGKHGRPFSGKGAFYNYLEEYPEDLPDYTDAAYYTYQPGPEDDDEEPADEAYAALKEDQKEFEEQRKDIEAMLAENDRNLAEADLNLPGQGKRKAKGQERRQVHGGGALDGKEGKNKFSKGPSQGPKGAPSWGHAYHLEGGVEFFSTSEVSAKKASSSMAAFEGLVDTGRQPRPEADRQSSSFVQRMRELMVMNAFIGCATGRCLINNNMVELRRTAKGEHHHEPSNEHHREPNNEHHHEPNNEHSSEPNKNQNDQPEANHFRFSTPDAKHAGYMLELQSDMSVGEQDRHDLLSLFPSQSDLHVEAAFLGIGVNETRYLMLGSADMTSETLADPNSFFPRPAHHGDRQHRRADGRDEEGGAGGCARGRGRGDEATPAQGQGQEPWVRREDRVRQHTRRQGADTRDRNVWHAGTGRPMYQPAPGEYTRTNLPQNVTEALERLRQQIKDAGAVEAKDVKNTIDIVAKEKRLIYGRPKSKAVAPPPTGKEKDRPKAKKNERKEPVQVTNSDDEFETVEPVQGRTERPAETWSEDDTTLPKAKAQELQQAAKEFDVAAILVHSKTLQNGYDMNKREGVNKLLKECWQQAPWKLWLSPSCILPEASQNITDDTKLGKKRVKVKKQLDQIVEIAAASLDNTNGTTHIYLEMPTAATGTWRSSGVRSFRQLFADRGQKLYRTIVDECMLRPSEKGPRGRKQWTILHNDGTATATMETGSRRSKAGPRYPKEMIERIAAIWKSQAVKTQDADEVRGIVAAAQQIDDDPMFAEDSPEAAEGHAHPPSQGGGTPVQQSPGTDLLPKWVVTEALNLHCQACLETRRGATMQVPHSMGGKPAPWQMLGMDVFEVFFPLQKRKARYLLAMCMVMRLTMVEMLWEGPMNEAGTDSGQKMVDVFAGSWLQHRPKPEWILTDPSHFWQKGASQSFVAGSVANGAVETAVKAIKKTMKRLRNESSELSPRLCGHLAAAAHNQTETVKGFSPVQWAYGSNPAAWRREADPLEVNRNQGERPEGFWKLQRWRSKAEEIHRQELAQKTFTRLHNAAPRPIGTVNPEARFIGPGRVALLEPPVMPDARVSVIWVLMGTSLWRCAPEQLRMASEQEDVMKGLRRFVDVTKEHDQGDRDGLPPEPWPDGAPEPEMQSEQAQPPRQWEDTLENAADDWAARRAASRERDARPPSRSRTPERQGGRTTVREQIARWQQMASANAARKLEGLPKLRRMPEEIEFGEVPDTWEIDEENRMLIRQNNTSKSDSLCQTHRQLPGTSGPVHRQAASSTSGLAHGLILKDLTKGSTRLEIKEGYDVLAPKRKEFENPPAPATKRAKERARSSEEGPKAAETTQEPAASATSPSTLGAVLSAELETAQEPAASTTSPSTLGASQEHRPDVFSLVEGDRVRALDVETILLVKKRIEQIENDTKQAVSLNKLRVEVKRMQRAKGKLDLVKAIRKACDRKEEAMVVEFDVEDLSLFVASSATYAKTKLASNTAAKEVNYRNLDHKDRARMDEAMARQISEVLRSQAIKAAAQALTEEQVRDRLIPMRWILTWKPVPDGTPPGNDKHEVSTADGKKKAKARIVLIGYKHPDLARRNARTGQPELLTASPTLSRLGRNMLLQAAALDQRTIECADAKSAFLQADKGIGTDPLFTRGVPELAMALGLTPGALMEVVGAVYGLTNAPRIFWLDVDEKMRAIGARPHDIDRCLWIFRSAKDGRIIGRVGTHVDDFIIAGDHNTEWMKIREKIKHMYATGSFTFAGLEIRQMKNYEVRVTQEAYCNSLESIEIVNDKSRSGSDPLLPKEFAQFRGLTMKAQWRAVQTAFQYCAKVGIQASSGNQATMQHLRDANALLKELRKTAKEDMVFHSFNHRREDKLQWNQLVGLHFGDAGNNNRPCRGAVGGYITGFAAPEILDGRETKERQAVYEAEDKDWKCRIFWALMYGNELTRSNAKELAAMMESLLITDSRGLYDATTSSDSPMSGMNNSRTGIEATAVQKGLREDGRCYLTWVPSDMNLADSLTKATSEAYKAAALYHARKAWIVRFNQEFVSARKQQRLRKTKQEQEAASLVMWPSDDFEAELNGLSAPADR
ncbi:TERC [Symbiodinium sp. CCMP2592]|nr:TERC [Symbiodinium sp. CCMP2592]